MLVFESGGPAFHARLVAKPLRAPLGRITPEQVREVVDGVGLAPAAERARAREHAPQLGRPRLAARGARGDRRPPRRELGLAVHLDGARLLNASVASGVPAASYGRASDSVTLCFSKGLGCPLGAVLAGSEELMRRAFRYKFLFGGALRQAGIVAAAMLHALDHHVERLADDHARAPRLAEALAAAGLPAEAETNFVSIDLEPLGLTAAEACSRAGQAGVLVSSLRPGVLRAVTLPRRRRRRRRARRRAAPARARRARPCLSSAPPAGGSCGPRSREQRLPSVTAAVWRRGEQLWAEAVGVADVERGEDATPEHQHRVASITKTFTAVSVLQLRDAGALDLDDRVDRYVAGLPRLADAAAAALARRRDPAREPGLRLGARGRAAERGGGDRAARRRRAGAARGGRMALLESRRSCCSARSSSACRDCRTSATWRSACSRRSGSSGRAGSRAARRRPATSCSRTRTGRELPADPRRRDRFRRALEHRRRPLPLGLVPVRPRSERPQREHGGRDAPLPDDGRPRALDARLGARADAVPPRRARLRRPLGRARGIPLERLLGPRVGHRRRARDELGCRDPDRERVGRPAGRGASGRRRPSPRRGARASRCLPSSRTRSDHGGRRGLSSRCGGARGGSSAWCPGARGRRRRCSSGSAQDRYRTVSGRERGELLELVRDDDGRVVKLYWASYPFTREPHAF